MKKQTKNIQVIEPAENCDFSIYSATMDDFVQIFPSPNQDVEFVEDLVARVGEDRAGELVMRATSNRIPKDKVNGIHGTLFIQYPNRRKYFPNKRIDDADNCVSDILRAENELENE